MILPSKKVLSFLIITTAFIIFTVLIFNRGKNITRANTESRLSSGENLKLPSNPEWQKILPTGSNKINPDAVSKEKNITDDVSTSLVSNYLNLKQYGDLSDETIESIVKSTSDYVFSNTKQTTSADIKITNNDAIKIHQYGEKLGYYILLNKPAEVISELAILEEIVDTNNPEKSNLLVDSANQYQSLYEDLLTIEVPETFSKQHLNILNGLLKIILGTREMSEVINDPFRGLQGVQIYQNGADLFMQSAAEISTSLRKNKIEYKQGSGGYYILYGI